MKNTASAFFLSGDKKKRGRLLSFALVIAAYIFIEVLLKTGNLSSLFKSLLVPITCYVVASIGLNLNVGVSGELNLGQAGFMSVGAFCGIRISGILANTVTAPIPRLVIAIICGACLAAVFGFLIGIPVLKLQGDYLAIVTLAFGQIIKSIFMNAYIGFDSEGLHFSFVESKFKLQPGGKMLLNGPMGATGTQKIANFTVGTILVIIALLIVYNLMFSRSGRAIMSARDNRIAAESVGINISRTKMLAFVVSAFLAGAAGALYGLNYATLVPNKFDFNTSILILVYVVLGGLGNMTGTMISTVILILLPELLRSLQDYRMLIYAVVLILIMLVTNNEWLKSRVKGITAGKAKGGASNG